MTALVCALAVGPRLPAHAQKTPAPPYKDPSLPVARRVDDLVSRMTLEVKVSQMMNGAAAIERLGVPAHDWWNEGLHGVARGAEGRVLRQRGAEGRAGAVEDGRAGEF